MTRRDDEPAESPGGLFGRLFRREKPEPQADGAAERAAPARFRLGGEEQEETLRAGVGPEAGRGDSEPSKPETPEQRAERREPPSRNRKSPKCPQPQAPETPAPQPDKKPTEKQSASRKKAVQYGPRTPQEQYEDREMQALKAMLFGPKPQPEARKAGEERPGSPGCPEAGTGKSRMPSRRGLLPLPELVFAEDKTAKPHAAPAMHFFGKGEDEETAPAPPARRRPAVTTA